MNTNRNQTIIVQAKTVDKALKEASQKLEIPVANLEYEIISQADAGILSFFGGRRVELKVWAKKRVGAESRRESSRKPAKKSESLAIAREPLDEETQESVTEDIKDFCAQICFHMTGELPAVTSRIDGDRLCLNIDSELIAELITKNSRLAEALEHLLRKKPRYLKRELPFRIFVDAQGVRSARELELVDIAKDISNQVAANQKPMVLDYKSSYDRKIIHMALDGDEKVTTKSIGSGPNRKLMVIPNETSST